MHRFTISMCLFFLIVGVHFSCKHDPILLDEDIMPIDTTGTNPIDTTVINPIDTTALMPCDPDKVYFELEILPILKSNCAFSGCHDAASAEDGVILESYESVMATADVEAFNLNDSELFEVLVDTDEEERMPPTPTDKLPAEQIQLIATWILQGAENLQCDPDLQVCETDNVSFSQFVQPLIDIHCRGCHSGNVPSGGIDLTNHTNIKDVVLNGRLAGAIKWDNGFSPMPQGGEQLSQCNIDKIVAWIDDGALDN